MPSPAFPDPGLDPLPSAAPRIVSASRVILAAGEPPVADGAVVIDGRHIVWTGPRSQLPHDYADLPRTDHPGATILPGLIETHAHLGSYASRLTPDVPDPSGHRAAWTALSSVATARQLASVGVTTVQSLGSPYFADVALREAIATGLGAGPRIVAAGPQLTTTGGHAWSNGAEVDSVTDIRSAVRRHHKAGTDLIKVMATGGFMTARTAPWKAQFTTEELRVLVEEAHRLGKHTAAHAHGTEGIRRAVDAGVDYIAHASFIGEDGRTDVDLELIDRIAERGIFVDTCSPPTRPPVEGETISPRAAELFQRGVRLVTGHDIGAVLPPSAYTFGLKQLEASGLPRVEVLRAATSTAAAAAGLAGVAGVLAPGYSADLIVAAGDPLADLSALDSLLEIVIAGRTFRPDPVIPYVPGSGRHAVDRTQDLRAARGDALERRRRHPVHPA